MSLYRSRWSRFPRTVTAEHARAGYTRQLGDLGSHRHPMPSWSQQQTAWSLYGEFPEYAQQQPPGPSVERDFPVHLFPSRNWENIDIADWIPFPALGTEQVILSFTVPPGRNGIINQVSTEFVGGGWIAGTGDVIWRILVDGATPSGANSYHNIKNSLGPTTEPVPISGFRISENQVLQVRAFNNPLGTNGGIIVSGQLTGARLLGYLYPRDMEYMDTHV